MRVFLVYLAQQHTMLSTPLMASNTPPSCTRSSCVCPQSTAFQTLRDNLQHLDVFAVGVKGNSDMVNAEFDKNYSQLLARGATLNDPNGILFEAYLLVPCYNFTKYIGTKHDDYLKGKFTGLTHEAMMSMAECKFDFLKTKGKWGAKSPGNEKILVMTAKIETLKVRSSLIPSSAPSLARERRVTTRSP